ncbi:MAG: tetratricopeptide repeat protein [Aeromicrobium sp.]|nr:tetratricopeptide repeat protein [Burkholderiales bacterium]
MADIAADIERAVALRTAGQHTAALAVLLDLLKVAPVEPKLNYEIACTFDPQGLEADAIPFYERALELGLSGPDRCGALLGLGSAYRCVEQYADAVRILERGSVEFPEAAEFDVFLALALYNMGEHRRSTQLLLNHIAKFPGSDRIVRLQRAIHYYADRPDPPYED